MSEHTNGFLKYEPDYKQGFVIWGVSNSIPGEVVSSCADDGRWGAIKDEANARRLVACWNACDGIPTFALELMTGDLSIEKQLMPAFKPVKIETSLAVERRHEIKSLRAVNAELLEALIGLDEAYCRAGQDLKWDERFEDRKRLIAARAAIASARKQENPHG